MNHSEGELREIINDLETEQLSNENGGQIVYDLITKTYAEYIEKKLPPATEKCLFHTSGKRQKGESMILYTQRKGKALQRT